MSVIFSPQLPVEKDELLLVYNNISVEQLAIVSLYVNDYKICEFMIMSTSRCISRMHPKSAVVEYNGIRDIICTLLKVLSSLPYVEVFKLQIKTYMYFYFEKIKQDN